VASRQQRQNPAHSSQPQHTLHYKYGGLNTAKLRHGMKVAPTANCLLCGQLDGGHHSMSGCPHMSGTYTERHNVGGRILFKALLKGGRGSESDVVMHDIGHAADAALLQHAPTSGGSFATRIPEWVYTKGRRRKPNVEEKSKWKQWHQLRLYGDRQNTTTQGVVVILPETPQWPPRPTWNSRTNWRLPGYCAQCSSYDFRTMHATGKG
jgi:hypothetical protein